MLELEHDANDTVNPIRVVSDELKSQTVHFYNISVPEQIHVSLNEKKKKSL